MNNTQEKCANASFCFNVATRWIGLRLDMICAFFTIITIVAAFAQKGRMNEELLILTVQSMTDVMAFFSVSVRMYAELENFMTSPQRLFEYSKL